jgi:CBS domain-containing protein
MKVADLMTREVVFVGPDATIKDVAGLLVEHRISGLPVCDDAGRVIGIVSEADILYRESEPTERDGPLAWLFQDTLHEEARKAAARTAGEAMSTPPITIGGFRTATAAARAMLENRVKRLPVVDFHGKLQGIVTRSDLVRAFIRTDAEIEREIRTDVVERTLWSGPEAVDVSVDGGEVTLTGQLETQGDVDILLKLVARVPGVLDVRSSVTYRVSEHRSFALRR